MTKIERKYTKVIYFYGIALTKMDLRVTRFIGEVADI